MDPGTTAKNGTRDVVIIDGQNFLFRAHYAHQRLQTSEGARTSCYHGVPTMFLEVMSKYPHADFIIVWDHFLPTNGTGNSMLPPTFPDFKRDLSKGVYKGNREKSDESLEALAQGRKLVKVFDNLGFLQLGVPGLEADDLIGIVANVLLEDKTCRNVLILSGDKDMFQLVTDRINVLLPTGKGYKRIDEEAIREEFGFPPKKFAKYLALGGDTCDNYKAIKGVGPKTAAALVKAGMDPSVKTFEELPGADQKKWAKYKDVWPNIYLCYKLAYIPRTAHYKLLPAVTQEMCVYCGKLAVMKRRRAMSRGQFNAAAKRYDEFCERFELGFLRTRKQLFMQGIEVTR